MIYVGTFSKVMFPALRLGYMVVPEDLVEAFSIARDATDQCLSHSVSGGDDGFHPGGTFRPAYSTNANALHGSGGRRWWKRFEIK